MRISVLIDFTISFQSSFSKNRFLQNEIAIFVSNQ